MALLKDSPKQSIREYFLPILKVRHALLEKDNRRRSKEEMSERNKHDQEGSGTLMGEKGIRY